MSLDKEKNLCMLNVRTIYIFIKKYICMDNYILIGFSVC